MSQEKKTNEQKPPISGTCPKCSIEFNKRQGGVIGGDIVCLDCWKLSSPIVEEKGFNRILTKEEITELYNKGIAVEKEGWEERFDEKFGIEYPFDNPLTGTARMKSFFKQTLAEERERIVKLIGNSRTTHENYGEGIREKTARTQAILDINIIKNNK